MSTLIRRAFGINEKIILSCLFRSNRKCQFNVINCLICSDTSLSLFPRKHLQIYTTSVRHKSKSKKAKIRQQEEESDDEEEETDSVDDWDKELVDKNTKIIQAKVNSLRVDVLLKAGLGMARSKIEEMFYESKIRVNGKKIFKKSELANEGDELDIIRGVDVNNPNFLTVARVEVLSISPKGEGYSVKLRRCKMLTIDNYEDPWQPS